MPTVAPAPLNAEPATGSQLPCESPGFDADFSEVEFWEDVNGSWRPLHGRIAHDGLSIEWHELRVKKPFAWAESFHPQSLEICLNLAGNARLEHDGRTLELPPRSLAFYCVGDEPITAERLPGKGAHEFLTIELSIATLQELLGSQTDQIHPLIATALQQQHFTTGLATAQPIYPEQDRWTRQLLEPPVKQVAERMWLRARVLEILAQCLFDTKDTAPLFCDLQKSLARQRVDKAIELLREKLEAPPPWNNWANMSVAATTTSAAPFPRRPAPPSSNTSAACASNAPPSC